MRFYAFEFTGENLVAGPAEVAASAELNRQSPADFLKVDLHNSSSDMIFLIRAQDAVQAIDRMVALYYRQVICAQQQQPEAQPYVAGYRLPVAAGAFNRPRTYPNP